MSYNSGVSYSNWITLFNKSLDNIWHEEPIEDLKKVAMLYSALQNEFRRIDELVISKIGSIRQKMLSGVSTVLSEDLDARTANERIDIDQLISDESEDQDDIPLDIPETAPQFDTANDQSDDTFSLPLHIAESPTISQRRRFIQTQRKDKLIPQKLSYDGIRTPPRHCSTFVDNCIESTPPQSTNYSTPTVSNFQQKQKETKISTTAVGENVTHQLGDYHKSLLVDVTSDSSMDIDQILSYINQHKMPYDKDSSIRSLINNRTEKDKSSTTRKSKPINFELSPAFLKKLTTFPNKELQKEPKYAYRPDRAIRGREERKQLRGWSCKSCEQYYKALDLSPSELQKKMDECSKHKSKFAPPPPTPPGFYDVSAGPSPRTQQLSNTSVVYQFGKRKKVNPG